MRLTSKPLGIILFVILFGGIAVTSAFGWWQTESTKELAKFATGEAAGEYNPADIRGSYTFGDIEKSFNVPAAVLAQAFNIPDNSDPASFTVKELEALNAGDVEIGTASVRLFVAWYSGLPFDLSTETYLPAAAVKVLKEHTSLTADQLAYLQTHTAPSADVIATSQPTIDAQATVVPTEVEATPTPSGKSEKTPDPEHTPEDRMVRGKTTFGDVLDWGVPEETITQIIGGKLPLRITIIRDYCEQNGLDFSTIKTQLQAEVDKRE
jgi:hypothetical protein